MQWLWCLRRRGALSDAVTHPSVCLSVCLSVPPGLGMQATRALWTVDLSVHGCRSAVIGGRHIVSPRINLFKVCVPLERWLAWSAVVQVHQQVSIECMCWTCPSVCACVCAGAVIGLVYSGPSSCAACQSVLVEVSRGSTGMVAVSSSSEVAARQVDTFFVSDIPRLAPSSSIRLRHR